jgi:hypothetical protein
MAESLFATNAFNHARCVSEALHSVLTEYDPSINYFIEVGFNEELIKCDGTMLEEIYVVITRASPSFLAPSVFFGLLPSFLKPKSRNKTRLLKELSQILSPFPAYIETANISLRVPLLDTKGFPLAWDDVGKLAWSLIPCELDGPHRPRYVFYKVSVSSMGCG